MLRLATFFSFPLATEMFVLNRALPTNSRGLLFFPGDFRLIISNALEHKFQRSVWMMMTSAQLYYRI